jgi:hypothetical protein
MRRARAVALGGALGWRYATRTVATTRPALCYNPGHVAHATRRRRRRIRQEVRRARRRWNAPSCSAPPTPWSGSRRRPLFSCSCWRWSRARSHSSRRSAASRSARGARGTTRAGVWHGWVGKSAAPVGRPPRRHGRPPRDAARARPARACVSARCSPDDARAPRLRRGRGRPSPCRSSLAGGGRGAASLPVAMRGATAGTAAARDGARRGSGTHHRSTGSGTLPPRALRDRVAGVARRRSVRLVRARRERRHRRT